MAQPRILHVITGTAIGGAEIMLLRYLRALGPARDRHSVVSMMPCGPVAAMIRDGGVEVGDLGAASARQIPAAIRRLQTVIRQRDPQVIHGWMYHGSLVATLALRLGRRPDIGLIWAIHHSLADPAREKMTTRAVLRGLRFMAERADTITYCAQQSAQQHAAFGLPPARAQFVPNAIDTQEFRPDPTARARLAAATGIPEGRRVIGSFARAHPMKDHPAFVQALAQLVDQGLDVQGLLIGNGQPGGPAEAEAARLGISDRLTTLPARDDIAALVPGLDAYLLSSAWGEALPLAVAEAMAAGVPAVVTDVGDCRWLVGDCGAAVPPRRPDLMARALSDLLALPADRRAALSAACRARIIQQLSLPDYITRHDALYRQAWSARASNIPAEAA
ncbi:glycosyltransferase [Paracoccus xiamenensis]|uniref:glycosyltransferase n=1 Tax=Paracoccus xiamenensis TaxID=2714901 RepID=UPI001409B0DA|nr:glycosyltransferase [Paracoccus xiamenensis]NHF73093.1 glycosyltransferase [Paracoccus xiamenensis]